jgi:hypothetical protein
MSQSPLYNSLNFPCQAPDLGSNNLETIDFWKNRHFLAGTLCQCASAAFKSKDKKLIMMVSENKSYSL